MCSVSYEQDTRTVWHSQGEGINVLSLKVCCKWDIHVLQTKKMGLALFLLIRHLTLNTLNSNWFEAYVAENL